MMNDELFDSTIIVSHLAMRCAQCTGTPTFVIKKPIIHIAFLSLIKNLKITSENNEKFVPLPLGKTTFNVRHDSSRMKWAWYFIHSKLFNYYEKIFTLHNGSRRSARRIGNQHGFQ